LQVVTKRSYDVTEAQITNKFEFLDFYVAALCNLGFRICGSYIGQVWPPLYDFLASAWSILTNLQIIEKFLVDN